MSKDVKTCENMKNTESLKMAQLVFIPAETTTTDSIKLKGIKKKNSSWYQVHDTISICVKHKSSTIV